MSYFEYVKNCYDEVPEPLAFGWEGTFRRKKVPSEKAFDYLRICRLCESLIRAFETPWPVSVLWKNLPVDVVGAADVLKKGGKEVMLNSNIYDTLPKDQILDCYQGVSLHEVCHLLHTHYFPTGRSNMWMVFWNLFEDERIEAKGRKKCPPFSYYFYVIKDVLLGKVEIEHEVWVESSIESKLMQFLFRWIRLPETLDDRYLTWTPAGISIHRRMLEICEWEPEDRKYDSVTLAQRVVELVNEILEKYKKGKSSEEKPEGRSEEKSEDTGAESNKGKSSEEESTECSQGGEKEGEQGHKEEAEKEERRVKAEEEAKKLRGMTNDYGYQVPRGEISESTKNGKKTKTRDTKKAKELNAKVERAKEKAKETGEMSSAIYQDEATFGGVFSVEAKEVLNKVVNFMHEHVTVVAEDILSGSPVPIITRRPLLTRGAKDQYDTDFASMLPYVQSLSRAFAIRQGVKVTRMAEKRRGRLSARHIPYGTVSDRVFYQNQVRTTTGVTLYILLDESGSMYSDQKIQNCRKLSILLQAALRQVPAVDLAIYGHTTGDSFGGDTRSCMLNIYFDKIEGVVDPARLGAVRAHSSNLDGYAIKEVGKRLLNRGRNTKKWMLVLSDGLPQAAGYGGPSATAHTSKEVKLLEKKGVQVIGVDIEGYNCDAIYSNNLKYTNPSTFVTQMRQFVLRLLKDQMDTVTCV